MFRGPAPWLRRIAGDARGVVFVEFIIAFVPVFVLFLGIVQLALLSAAQLVVQHAAIAGARAASVVLDDDPRYYDGTARGDVSGTGASAEDSFEHGLAHILGEGAPASGSISLGGPRMAAIRRAVHVPLAAITPEPALLPYLIVPAARRSLMRVLGTSPASRLFFGLNFYLPLTTAVTFPKAPGSAELLGARITPNRSVTVRVTHLVPCAVPVVSVLMCGALDSASSGGDTRARARAEINLAPGASMLSMFRFTRVALMQAEASMPSQRAGYAYASEQTASGS
jgi:hypothetical protein